MPSFVIAQSGFGRIGETIEATLCDPSVAGFPDRKTDVPIQVRLVSEQTFASTASLGRSSGARGETGSLQFWLMAAKVSAIESGASPWRELPSCWSSSDVW